MPEERLGKTRKYIPVTREPLPDASGGLIRNGGGEPCADDCILEMPADKGTRLKQDHYRVNANETCDDCTVVMPGGQGGPDNNPGLRVRQP